MDKFGLIGDPISTSLSPTLFKAGYAGKYQYDLIEGSDFEASFKRFKEGYKAINVTAPFKELALAKADIATNSSMKIGAANILVKTSEGIEAHNSDFTGIILCIADALIPGIVAGSYSLCTKDTDPIIGIHQVFLRSLPNIYPSRPEALIVGCGGAGKAAAVAAAELGFHVTLMNRTQFKADKLASELQDYDMAVVPIEDFVKSFRKSDLVIYSLPMAICAIQELKAADFKGKDRYVSDRPGKVILEANYKSPSFSGKVKEKLDKYGCQYIPGRKWLLYQALTGYALMTGASPAFQPMVASI